MASYHYFVHNTHYLDEVILLWTILIEKTSGGCCRDKKDGLESDFSLSCEVDVTQGLVSVLHDERFEF